MKFGNEELSLDLIIMAAEMLTPTRYVGDGLPTVTVYAVVEDCINKTLAIWRVLCYNVPNIVVSQMDACPLCEKDTLLCRV
jgi:hypothetical protein